jgi:hypothetical protein
MQKLFFELAFQKSELFFAEHHKQPNIDSFWEVFVSVQEEDKLAV